MTESKRKFDKNIESILILETIYDFLYNQITVCDISEILRAQYVMTVSALDFYIHEVVRDGLLQSFERQESISSLRKVSIPLDIVKVLLNIENQFERKQLLNEAIKAITSKDSYQSPKAIEQALGLLNIKCIWSKLYENSDESAEGMKKKLALIVNRRNKIAHEADINFLTGEKEPIDKQVVIDCLNYIGCFVARVDHVIESNFI